MSYFNRGKSSRDVDTEKGIVLGAEVFFLHVRTPWSSYFEFAIDKISHFAWRNRASGEYVLGSSVLRKSSDRQAGVLVNGCRHRPPKSVCLGFQIVRTTFDFVDKSERQSLSSRLVNT